MPHGRIYLSPLALQSDYAPSLPPLCLCFRFPIENDICFSLRLFLVSLRRYWTFQGYVTTKLCSDEKISFSRTARRNVWTIIAKHFTTRKLSKIHSRECKFTRAADPWNNNTVTSSIPTNTKDFVAADTSFIRAEFCSLSSDWTNSRQSNEPVPRTNSTNYTNRYIDKIIVPIYPLAECRVNEIPRRHSFTTTTIPLTSLDRIYPKFSCQNLVDHFWTTLYNIPPPTLAFLSHVPFPLHLCSFTLVTATPRRFTCTI